MKAVIFNLGCKVNQYECDVIAEKLAFEGYEVTQDLSYADIYVINTCAVTSEAERKSRQAISRCLRYNPNAKIYIMGCASQNAPEPFKKDNVEYILGSYGKKDIVEHIVRGEKGTNIVDFSKKYEEMSLFTPHRTRAFVKIQDGCDHFCSYCIIPFVRGRNRSRDIDSIEKEIRTLAPKTKEIVLTGIDVMSYGKDIGCNLENIFDRIKDVDVRLRLSSVYAEKITPEMLEKLFSLKKFCPHFHLSLQSGDNSVLKSMNRHYTAEEYLSKIELIRSFDENAGITTDVIVGFPTEGEKEFDNTCRFVREAAFSDLHIFPYSARKGTVAAKMPQNPREIINERKNILANIKKDLHTVFLKKNIGIPQEVLLEQESGNKNVGYSRNYIKIYTEKTDAVCTVIPKKLYNDGLTEV